ncbi:hypothetical protein A2935_03790 [Candidatus Wolfebacteria bacterium RIFCSPLOWO2_01_FULL_47_17b]|uniref:Uncharacterized protein n=1 Tax=Candidatus Wolfebacteria bacterium RIFCSPLOWO2_01_FULL_47_17b TaxID=1802558 RepID=A0A1F8DWU0_9BACT|nr:MAG: hypothetical protein A2935_03790 [Candidatus Wolfebacteria bacterium RIFCSPLOWO2_01_FULL_47_17b]
MKLFLGVKGSKALSKIAAYLLISFFVVYQLYFLGNTQLIFAATPIVFDLNQSTPASPATYIANQNKSFSVSITPASAPADANGVIFQIGRNITLAYSNVTRCANGGQTACTWNDSVGVFRINFTEAQFDRAGVSNFTWFANDSSGAGNKTDTIRYALNQNSSTLNFMNLTINDTESSKEYSFPAGSNATGWYNSAAFGASPITFTLLRNGSSIGTTNPISDVQQLSAAAYNYTYYADDTTNFSSARKELSLVVSSLNVTIFLNTTKVWWNDSIYASGLASFTNGTIDANDAFRFFINGIDQCSGTTNSSGGWSCKFRAPVEIGTFEARISLTATTASNTTILYVRPSYGPTPIGTSDRSVYENPFLIQDENGRLKTVIIRITAWPR